jgi:hypothetical protein
MFAGNHFSDALLKGIKGFDHECAYKAMVNTVMRNESGLSYHKALTYIPDDEEIE